MADGSDTRSFVGEAPGADEVPVVGWPFLFEHRIRRLRSRERSPWWVLVAVLTGLFATGFSITIIAVSLPRVAHDLHTSPDGLTWVVTGPLLGLALTMPLFGKIGDTRGHRRVYLLGFAGFTVGAACTALAWNGPALVAIRTIGAIPGAAIGPASMALIMQAFPESERVKAMGWWSLVGAGAPVIGLVAGGPVVEAFGWRSIFIAQVPLSVLALALAVLVLHETPRREKESLDVAGAAALAVATVAALLALTFGARWGILTPVPLVLLAIAPLALWRFVVIERRSPRPLLPLRFFQVRDFTASLVAQFCANFAYMGGFIVTPLLVQSRFGFTVAATSWAMACRPLTFSVSAPGSGYLAARIGERQAGIVGMTLLVASMAMFVVATAGDLVGLVFAGLALSGLAMGASMPSLVTVVANTVPTGDLGVANAAQQMVAQIGTVTGIQLLSTIQGGSDAVVPFAAAYVVGGAVAGVGVVAAAFIASRRPAAAVPVADAA
ncbi:MAG: MFS transporter [Acidimicrobiia bacterium]